MASKVYPNPPEPCMMNNFCWKGIFYMAQAAAGDTVKVHYTGRLDDGEIFDTSREREPLEFTIGQGEVIPGFEAGVLGMTPGESKTITIPAAEAYGPHRSDLIAIFNRAQFPPNLHPEIGQQLQLTGQHGQQFVLQVVAMDDTSVKLDANHPLAGKELTFDLELVEIEEQDN